MVACDIIEVKDAEGMHRWLEQVAEYLAATPLGGMVEFGSVKVQVRDKKPTLATLEITIKLD